MDTWAVLEAAARMNQLQELETRSGDPKNGLEKLAVKHRQMGGKSSCEVLMLEDFWS